MALPKVCGLETEYGIVVRGAENNPVTASSMLINAYVAATARRARPHRLGLRGRTPHQRRPRVLPRRLARPRGRDHARQRRAHQRCALLRRPRPSGDLHAGGHHGDGSGDLGPRRRGDRPGVDDLRPVGAARRRRDRRAQEQLRRQGQQLRLPRELPARPRAAVRPSHGTDHAALRHPPGVHAAPARSAANFRAARTTTSRTSSASVPTSSKRRSASRPRSSDRSSTPATSRTPTPRSTAACT